MVGASMMLLLSVAATASLSAASAAPLPDLCHLGSSGAAPLPQFSGYHGSCNGSASAAGTGGGCATLHAAGGAGGCAGDFNLGTYDIVPLQHYVISLELKTSALLPTPQTPENCVQQQQTTRSGGSTAIELGLGGNQTACAGAYITGAPYVSYTDGNGRADGWFPAYGTHATPTSDWHNISLRFAPPSTATRATIRLAFGAHQYDEGNGGRMLGGTATGEAWFRNVKIVALPSPPSAVLPATFEIPASEKNMTRAIELAASCLHNSQISGNFTVGSDYVISGNLSPDLAFGLLGTRRLAHASYMKTWESTWLENRNLMNAEGRIGRFQRVMAHVLWPLGVDALFSFSGNTSYLEENLAYVDRAMGYLKSIAAEDDSLPCFTKDLMELFPPGVDWNDWQDSRAYGATTNFATWYVRTLRRFAALHTEFAGSFGSAAKAKEYYETANAVTLSVQALWIGENSTIATDWERDGPHFATNARHSADCGHNVLDDGVWVDDQLWAVVNGVADDAQAATIKEWLANRTVAYESQPTRWSSKTKSDIGLQAKQRYAETWYGRLGMADVLMRFKNFSQPAFGYTLLRRISAAFASSNNIMESYTMDAEVGTDPGTDYLEHCGGFMWSIIDGPFGVDFNSVRACATNRKQLTDCQLTALLTIRVEDLNSNSEWLPLLHACTSYDDRTRMPL